MKTAGRRVVRIYVTPDEDAVVRALRIIGNYRTDANLLRDALWSMAEEMGLPIPEGAFTFMKPGNPRPHQAWAGSRVKHLAKPTVQITQPARHTRKPAKMHPWRQHAI